MANTRTLTAANAILTIGVESLYPQGRRLQGFSADDITDIDALAIGEGSMGVDGRLSAGFVFNPVPQNITLQADSESNDMFETWAATERLRVEKFVAFGSILLPATGARYTLTRGFLMSTSVLPAVRKTLQARRYSITWERVTPSPV